MQLTELLVTILHPQEETYNYGEAAAANLQNTRDENIQKCEMNVCMLLRSILKHSAPTHLYTSVYAYTKQVKLPTYMHVP